jgi:hypothetical protein
MEPALPADKRRQREPVCADEFQKNCSHSLLPIFSRTTPSSDLISPFARDPAFGRAITTQSPGGNSLRFSLKYSLITRLTRFLTTAFPTLPPTTTPNLLFSAGVKESEIDSVATRILARRAALQSRTVLTRSLF